MKQYREKNLALSASLIKETSSREKAGQGLGCCEVIFVCVWRTFRP